MAMTVYVIRNTINGKTYVGQTCNRITHRLSCHKYAAKCGSPSPLHKDIVKYGADKFTISPAATARSRDELDTLEQEWIRRLRSSDPHYGYNRTVGGRRAPTTLGHKHSRATKAKMSRSQKIAQLGHTVSEETRKKLSIINRGKVLSSEQIAKMRKALIGRPVSTKTRKKISAALKGRKFSKEWREKLSRAHKGVPLTEEHRKQIGRAQLGKSHPRRKI